MVISKVLRCKNLTHLYGFKDSSFPCYLRFSPLVHLSTVSNSTVSDYLLHKHHFSPEAASRVASSLTRLRDPEKSDSILSFFKELGFSKTLVEKIVTSVPVLLSSDLEKTIKPKIKILQDLDFSSDDIANVLSHDPRIFQSSVNYLEPNVKILKSCGVGMEQIIWFVCYFRRFIFCKPERMKKLVDKVNDMGVCMNSRLFMHAVRVMSSMNSTTWKQKMRIFRDMGFSDEEILAAFRQVPLAFGVSAEKINEVKEVILATGKYEFSCILKNPVAFTYSVENRFKPRCKVLGVLERENLIKSWPSLATLCRLSDRKFYDKFVGPYLDKVGDVYEVKSSVSGDKR
ncbi:Unknown protein [Striga hermonthica]|uniref:Uncharacterized protein n=1 Tax=Striga hermonthica TaxID=68872 RepID=A0A9N7RT53_STRHE|nr:Unknown protein [Striga hermonthica]